MSATVTKTTTVVMEEHDLRQAILEYCEGMTGVGSAIFGDDAEIKIRHDEYDFPVIHEGNSMTITVDTGE